MFIISLLISLISVLFMPEENSLEIPAIFSDNMVLQQRSNVPFWGKAKPGLTVNLKASWGASAKGIVKDDGTWMLKIKTPKAGGPFTVDLHIGDKVIHYSNVLIGEVWLCSGQSNMEMPLMGWPPADTINNSAYEISNAVYPEIRFATVQRAFSDEKQYNCNTSWQECTPASAEMFSATAFFFAKKLYKELKVPVGLIHSSWGGTPVEAWTSEEYITKFEQYKNLVEDLKNSKAEFALYREWLMTHTIIDLKDKPAAEKWKGLDFSDEKCSAADFNDSGWPEMTLPVLWENSPLGSFDGVIWFRKKVVLPEEFINQDLTLVLGPIDDMDRAYVNGVLVGSHEGDGYWQKERIYKIPADLLKKAAGADNNEITIAVRVMDNQGGGGIYGDAAKMKIYSADNPAGISIAGAWKYMPAAEFRDGVFYVFDPSTNEFTSRPKVTAELSPVTPTSLYNAMIHPIVHYAIKGAIWYQGESNVDRADSYADLFTAMINNWRSDWNVGDFPFYFVQIAPYNYGAYSHSEKLREAQLKVSSYKNTGMVVTLDIGNNNNIHPGNKKDVGERLANLALAKDYKKKVPFTGPVYKSMKSENGRIVLSFDHSKCLHLKAAGKSEFLIAGDDRIFREAEAEVDGDKLIVYHPQIKDPKAVRYAWSNTALAVLFNGDGLPASSFRTDDWEE